MIVLVIINIIISLSAGIYRATDTLKIKTLNYRWEDESLIFLHLDHVETDVSLIRGSIQYENGIEFFKGTFYGNSFNTGIFRYSDGSLMFEKK